jgi:hypothetical protein
MTKRKSQPTQYITVTAEVDGRKVSGQYTIGAGKHAILTVYSDNGGRKSTQLGGLPPETLARMLLAELGKGPA